MLNIYYIVHRGFWHNARIRHLVWGVWDDGVLTLYSGIQLRFRDNDNVSDDDVVSRLFRVIQNT